MFYYSFFACGFPQLDGGCLPISDIPKRPLHLWSEWCRFSVVVSSLGYTSVASVSILVYIRLYTIPRPSFQDIHTICQSPSFRGIVDVSSCWSLSRHFFQDPESLLWVSFVFLQVTKLALNVSVLVVSCTLGEFLVKSLPSTSVTCDNRSPSLIRYP